MARGLCLLTAAAAAGSAHRDLRRRRLGPGPGPGQRQVRARGGDARFGVGDRILNSVSSNPGRGGRKIFLSIENFFGPREKGYWVVFR